MNKFKYYMKDRYKYYMLYLLIMVIFYGILSLYHVLNDAIAYALVLSSTLMIAFFCIDFYQYVKKLTTLEYLLTLDMIEMNDLPRATSSIEEYYQDILYHVDSLSKSLENRSEQSYQDMIQYYTLWVHQIKTPISALRLLIQSDSLSHKDLLIQIQRIEQYVEMVLHYIRIEHMSSDMILKNYQLENIVNDVVKKQAPIFIYKKIQLQLDEFHLSILTDEKWISFVIDQLLSNALKYTKEGSIHIYVEGETLYIEDTGMGIRSEDLPRLFEKGFTGYNGRIDKKASGLGLFLCKRVIDQLGYQIHIESQLHQGTQVSIDFHVDHLNVE